LGKSHTPIPISVRFILFLSALLPLAGDCSYLIAVDCQDSAAALLEREGTCAMANGCVSDDDLMARGY
jgi:hypothetical protein